MARRADGSPYGKLRISRIERFDNTSIKTRNNLTSSRQIHVVSTSIMFVAFPYKPVRPARAFSELPFVLKNNGIIPNNCERMGRQLTARDQISFSVVLARELFMDRKEES